MSLTLLRSTPSGNSTIYAKLTVVALLWGGTFVAGRLAAVEISPLVAATARFGLASLALILLLWKTEGGLPRLTWRQVVLVTMLGVFGVCLYNLFFFAALAEMPASRTALFVAFNPIAVALAGGVMARQFIPCQQASGIGIALFGALIVISRGDIAGLIENVSQSFGSGEVYMIGAVGSWAGYTILGRAALGAMSPLAATTWAAMVGFLLLALHLVFVGPVTSVGMPSWNGILAIFYLALGGTVLPFVWYYQGVRELGMERTAVFTNLVPLFGVMLGALLLQETVGVAMMLGGALVVIGVYLTNRS